MKSNRPKGFGSVNKVGPYYYFRRTSTDGKRTSYALKNIDGANCTTQKEAFIAAGKIADELNAIAEINSREEKLQALSKLKNLRAKLTVTMDSALELAFAKPRKIKPTERYLTSVKSCWLDFAKFLEDKFQITSIADVDYTHAEQYVAHLQQFGRWTAKKSLLLSNKTVNTFIKNCRAVFNLLLDDLGYRSDESPFAKLKLMRSDAVNREIFDEDELRMIFQNPPPMIRGLFTIGLCTGLRLGDAATLQWHEIKSYAPSSFGKPNFQLSEIVKKTSKTKVAVSIPIMRELADFFTSQWEISGQDVYVLPDAANMYIHNSSGIHYRVIRYLNSLGIETSRAVEGRSRRQSVKDFHSLRHCFCYYAGLRGIALPVVQAIVGHMNPAMTSHYQQHASREEKRKALQMMQGLVIYRGQRVAHQAIGSPIEELMRLRVIDYIETAQAAELLKVNCMIDEITQVKHQFESENILDAEVVPALPAPDKSLLTAISAPTPEALTILIKKFNRPRIAKIFDVSETTIRKWLAKHNIPAPNRYRLNGRIEPEELDKLRDILNRNDFEQLKKYQEPPKKIIYYGN